MALISNVARRNAAALLAAGGAALVGFSQAGAGALPRTEQAKHRERVTIADYPDLATALTALAGAEGTGYGANPVDLDLLGTEITFAGTVYWPINVTPFNGKLTSVTGKIVLRNPYLANTALRGYTTYWPYMTARPRHVVFNCLTVINCYIGTLFDNCAFDQANSALVMVNSNTLWTEYNVFRRCVFASNAGVGAAILLDGNSSGTSIYSTGAGAGTSTGSFGYTLFEQCKIDSTAPANGIKVTGGAVLYNATIGFSGYARGNGPSGAFLYVENGAVNSCTFDVRLESFGASSNIISLTDTASFWYNSGSIKSASPQMVFAQTANADVRSNDIVVIGASVSDSAGNAVPSGGGYRTRLNAHTVKREWTEPAFAAYLTNAQALTSNVTAKITQDTEEFDTNSNFASSRFSPNVAGYYQINAQARFAATATAGACFMSLYKNGGEYRRCDAGTLGAAMVRSISTLVYLNGSTDYIEMFGYVFDNGGAPSVVSGAANTFLNGCLLKKA